MLQFFLLKLKAEKNWSGMGGGKAHLEKVQRKIIKNFFLLEYLILRNDTDFLYLYFFSVYPAVIQGLRK